MSKIYGEAHREIQTRYDAKKLADKLEETIVLEELTEPDQGFISSRDMFFLSTVDQNGRPTVSYKGGEPGFIKVINEKTIAFPSYNGNGMFYSMGNIAQSHSVGMLFIDFENPHRLRLQGNAELSYDDPLIKQYHEAELIVQVTVEQIWVNCPRYIHRYKKLTPSHYLPKEGCKTPIAEWKRIDKIQDSLPKRDIQALQDENVSPITMEEYQEKVVKSEG